MSSQLRIFLPCDVFMVRVTFGSGSEVTELEHLFLRAVRAGEHSISALRDLFGLTERMVHDVLFDLWKIGYLVISFDRGEIFLAGEAAAWAEGKGELTRLASLEAEDIRHLMIDRFVGHVFPLAGESSSPNPYFVTPDLLGPLPISEATTEKLIAALGRVAASESPNGVAVKKVLSAYVPFNGDETIGGQRWYGVDVIASIAEDTSRFAAHVVTTRHLPPGVRHSIERELARLVAERPDHELSKALVAHASGNRWKPRDPKKALALLHKRLGEVSTVSLSDCISLDQELRLEAGDLAAEIEERRIAEASIRIIAGSQDHDEIVQHLIKNARHQIVISSPYVSERGLGKLRHALSERMGEGVRVFMMWGLANVDAAEGHLSLSNEARNIVNGLEARFPDHFFWTYLPSRTHAKVIVQDDQRALITSLNILDPSLPSVVEVGILIEEHSRGARPAVISDLLSWARRTYPIYQDSRAILHAIPRSDSRNDIADPGVQIHFEFPPEPPEVLRSAQAGISRAAADVWLNQWRSFTDRMQEELYYGQTAARLIIDEEHTRIIENALATTRNRLLIISDKISLKVVTKEFLARAVKLCENHVQVRFAFRRFVGDAKAEEQIKEILEEARLASEQRFSWVQINTHAKVIIADDSAVITSFNPLSFAGAFPEQWAALGRRQSSELGALCTGLGAADSVIAALERCCPAAVLNFMRSPLEASTSITSIEDSSKDLSKMIVSALAGGENAEVPLEDVFGMSDRPWELLEQVATGLEAEALRKTIGTCMAVTGSLSNQPGDEQWVRRLAETSWTRLDPFETALLVAALENETPDTVPTLEALLISIALSDDKAVDVVLDHLVMINNQTESDSGLIVLFAMVALLGFGRATAIDLLVHGAVLTDPWPNALTEVESYWTDTYEPFPVHYFYVQRSQEWIAPLLEARWIRLEDSFKKASRQHFRFPEGTKIWNHLFHADGCFGRLHKSIMNRNSTGVRTWLRSEPLDDLDALLVNTAVEVHGSEKQTIAGNKKVDCINALSSIVEGSRELIALIPESSSDDPNWFLDRATALRNSLNEMWPGLTRSIKMVVTPESMPISNRALDHLRNILSIE